MATVEITVKVSVYVSWPKTSCVGQLTWFVIRRMETLIKKQKGSPRS
jgi:hypothetical protein